LAARVATAAALIAALLGALFLLPRTALAALIALLVLGAAHEWARLCRLERAAAWAYALLVAACFVAVYSGADTARRTILSVGAVFWLAVAPLWLALGVRASQRSALILAGLIVLVPAALAMVSLSPAALLGVLVLIWIADTAAYFVGRAWGRRKLAPTVSPGKTWEGAAGGLIGALAYAIICGGFLGPLAWSSFLGAAALIAALSIVGDLFESAAKRQASVKDSGTLLPGHGGILDRIDSATSTLPLAALILPLMKGHW
jgi:phosphatidate cytidylyltransferase